MFQKRKNRKLLIAAKKGNVIDAKKLIASGADINARDETGNLSVLMVAIGNNNELFALSLIEKGADVNAVSLYRDTALHWAVLKKLKDTVNALLDAGANIDARKKDGGTALTLAATGGYLQIVKTLLNRGADYSIVSHAGHSAQELATANGHSQVAKILKDAAAGNIPKQDGWTRTAETVTCRHSQLDEGVSLKEYVDFANQTYTTIVHQNGKISHTCQNFNEVARGILVEAMEPLNAIEAPKKMKALPGPEQLI